MTGAGARAGSGPLPPAPPVGRREQIKAANRAAILGAARDVFADTGYGAANIRDIVRRTDLAAGTFYNYFPDKESVFRALVHDVADRTRTAVREARACAATMEEFVEGGFRAYFQFVSEDRDTLLLTRRNAGTVRALFDEPAIGAGTAELEADLRDGVARGLLPEHDTQYMAAAMVGAALELALRMVERDPPDVEGATALATRVFAAGLRERG